MKISLNLESLQTALKLIQKAIPSNPQLPILSSIHLKINNSQLTLSATDLYLGIKATVPVKTEENLEIVVPGETFKEFVNSFSTDDISLEVSDKQVLLNSGKSRVKIPVQSASDYPDFPEIEGETISLPAELLEEVKNLVSFAASTDQTRPVLTAILLNLTKQGLEVVGTDGFRLAVLNYPEIKENTGQLLIPVKAFNEVCRLASQVDSEFIDLQVSPELKQVKFQFKHNEVYVRLIEGDYPPYEKIIPESFEVEAAIDGENFRKELQRAFVLAREASNIVKLKLNPDNLEVSSASPAFGEYQGQVLLAKQIDAEKEIAFNTTYLLDFLNSVKPESLSISMNESLKPAMFKISNQDNFKYVVMPFRVND